MMQDYRQPRRNEPRESRTSPEIDLPRTGQWRNNCPATHRLSRARLGGVKAFNIWFDNRTGTNTLAAAIHEAHSLDWDFCPSGGMESRNRDDRGFGNTMRTLAGQIAGQMEKMKQRGSLIVLEVRTPRETIRMPPKLGYFVKAGVLAGEMIATLLEVAELSVEMGLNTRRQPSFGRTTNLVFDRCSRAGFEFLAYTVAELMLPDEWLGTVSFTNLGQGARRPEIHYHKGRGINDNSPEIHVDGVVCREANTEELAESVWRLSELMKTMQPNGLDQLLRAVFDMVRSGESTARLRSALQVEYGTHFITGQQMPEVYFDDHTSHEDLFAMGATRRDIEEARQHAQRLERATARWGPDTYVEFQEFAVPVGQVVTGKLVRCEEPPRFYGPPERSI